MEREGDWVDEVCTWARFQQALSKAEQGTAVGEDGFSACLLKKAPEEVQRCYYDWPLPRFFSRATANFIFIFFLFLKLKLRFFARFFLPKSLLSRFASRASCFES